MYSACYRALQSLDRSTPTKYLLAGKHTQGITIPKKTLSIWYFTYYIILGILLVQYYRHELQAGEHTSRPRTRHTWRTLRSFPPPRRRGNSCGRSRYDSLTLTPLTLSLCKTIQLYRYRHRYLTCDWSGMTGGLKFGTRGACIWPGGLACAN